VGPLDTPNIIEVFRVLVKANKRREFELAFWARIWCGGDMPDLQLSAKPDDKVPARRGERQGCDRRSEGEVIYRDAPQDVRQNRMAIFVNGEKQVPSRGQPYP